MRSRPGKRIRGSEICPRCGNTMIPILYGLAVPDDELMEQLRKGEVHLGGCVVDPHRRFHCNTCEGR